MPFFSFTKNHRTCDTMIPRGHEIRAPAPEKECVKENRRGEERQPQRMWREEEKEREESKRRQKQSSRGRQQNTLEVEDDGSARNTSFPTTIPCWNRMPPFWNFSMSFEYYKALVCQFCCHIFIHLLEYCTQFYFSFWGIFHNWIYESMFVFCFNFGWQSSLS